MESDGAILKPRSDGGNILQLGDLEASTSTGIKPIVPLDKESSAVNGCGCDTEGPEIMQSAWEQAATLRMRGGESNSALRIIPREALDLRIFCGTWNVAGECSKGS